MEGGINDAVLGTGEDGLGGLEVVEAGPEDVGGVRVGDVVGLAFVVFGFAQAGEAVGVEPLQRGFDDGDDFGRGGAAAHEELHEVRGFAAAERRRLFGAGFHGLERERVMLGAPDGGLAVDADLHGGDVGDAFVERDPRPLLQRGIGEGEVVVALGEVVEDLQDVHHGIVIERDGLVVAALDGVILRPAAVRILRGENVVEALHQRGLDVLALRGGEDTGEELDVLGGGAVVKGAAVVPGVAFLRGPVRAGLARAFRVIDRLGPTAGGCLVADDDFGELLVLRAGKPLRRRVVVVLKLGAIARCGLGFGLGAFCIEDAVLIRGRLTRLGDVGAPFGPLGFRELREELVGEQGEGLFGGLSEERRAKSKGRRGGGAWWLTED